MSFSEERVHYKEDSNNGLLLDGLYIPEELLSDILCCYIDLKTLLSCQLVCKHWQYLIQNYVWRKKAEMTIKHTLPIDKNTPWTTYYLICEKKPFYRNLIKNHSGEISLIEDKHWEIMREGGNNWSTECPPVGVPPLPDDPVFNEKQNCFVTSYRRCWKRQVVDLIKEGFTEYLLDSLQPTIKVGEWFSARYDCPAIYRCTVELLGKEEGSNDYKIFDSCEVFKTIRGENQNQWFRHDHIFANYGPGVRKIRFSHGGEDSRNWAGHYGSKMAGAFIKIEVPD